MRKYILQLKKIIILKLNGSEKMTNENNKKPESLATVHTHTHTHTGHLKKKD